MHPELREFLFRWIGVAASALVPVLAVAFLSMPLSLSRHPGEVATDVDAPVAHMT